MLLVAYILRLYKVQPRNFQVLAITKSQLAMKYLKAFLEVISSNKILSNRKVYQTLLAITKTYSSGRRIIKLLVLKYSSNCRYQYKTQERTTEMKIISNIRASPKIAQEALVIFNLILLTLDSSNNSKQASSITTLVREIIIS